MAAITATTAGTRSGNCRTFRAHLNRGRRRRFCGGGAVVGGKMTQRVLGPTGSPRRHWTVLLSLVAALAFGLLYIGGASAQLDRTLFELDRNATDDTNFTKIGVLNAQLNPDTTPPLSSAIEICQDQSAFYTGAQILIDAERMTLNGGANVGGGGCPTGFTFKRSYTATRGVGGTSAGPAPAGQHAKGENISKIDTGSTGILAGDDWDEVFGLVGD